MNVARFVEREIRADLECGVLAHGFLRVHCDACGHDRLVTMAETGVHDPEMADHDPANSAITLKRNGCARGGETRRRVFSYARYAEILNEGMELPGRGGQP